MLVVTLALACALLVIDGDHENRANVTHGRNTNTADSSVTRFLSNVDLAPGGGHEINKSRQVP